MFGIRRIVETNAEIIKRILEALADCLNDAFVKAAPKIRTRYSNLLLRHITSQPEYDSLIEPNGVLRREFGLDTHKKVEDIVKIWAKSIIIDIKRVKANTRNLTGGLIIQGVQGDYLDVLNHPSAIQITDIYQQLPWLEWLILEGDRAIVRGYSVKTGRFPTSRSGHALMFESSYSWGVPHEYMGTIHDNWITRAINSMSDDEVINIIKEEIERVM